MSLEQASAPLVSSLRRLPRLLIIAGVALFLALLAYGLTTTAPDDTIDQRLREGHSAAAPGFALELLTAGKLPHRLETRLGLAASDGKLSPEELAGVPVVLNFWASWCSPCAEEAPLLQRGWERWGERGVLFLGLDMQDLRGDARDFLKEHGIDYPSVRDRGKGTANDYGATGIPETYFISARGQVVDHVVGSVSARQLDAGVGAARSGKPRGSQRGGARRPTR